MRSTAVQFCAAVSLLVASQATAVPYTVGSKTIEVLPEPGYCLLDSEASAFDRATLEAHQRVRGQTGKVLAVSLDCQRLASLRAGQEVPLGRHSVLHVLFVRGKPFQSGYSRAEFLSKYAAAMEQRYNSSRASPAEQISRAFERLSSVRGDETGPTQATFGVLQRDMMAVYTGHMTALSSPIAPPLMASVTAMTMVDGYAFELVMNGGYDDQTSYRTLIEATIPLVEGFVATNATFD